MEKRVSFLVNQFQSGVITDAEEQELILFINNHPTVVSDEITRMIAMHEGVDGQVEQDRWQTMVDQILAVDKPKLTKRPNTFSRLRWVGAAAAIILALAVVWKVRNGIIPTKHVFTTDVKPGGNKAILTLADGKKISLSDAQNGALIKEAGISISKSADGELVYNVEKLDQPEDDSRTNTISTPNGGEWQIILPDGSKIWLNAASSLEYPLNIGIAKTRKVKLQGEAYFEVAKNAQHPFIVETAKQKLEVLGTHFNVNSYLDEKITRTTLLEGSVRISDILDLAEYEVLKPGEQSVLSDRGIKVNTVDPDESVAWKNGYFMFNNERQESILRKVARWYNVQIEYADEEAKNVMYYGTVSRFNNISLVLTKFEQTGEVKFDIKGNKVIVHKD